TCASSILLTYYIVTYIWLSTCLSPCQTAFDAHNQRSAQVIHHAQVALGVNSDYTQPSQPPFAMEMGVIQPLYFVALKCRHHIIRQRALSLLWNETPKTDALWNSKANREVRGEDHPDGARRS